MLKLIGLSLILTASGAVGAGLAGTVRRQQAQTLALIDALLRIRHELLYRLTPLPEIFTVLSGSRNREIAEFALDQAGAHVTIAFDGREAVDAFAAAAPGTFDLVLMDIMMPNMNGYEATRAIRAMNRTDAKRVPIVAMSANAFADDVAYSRESGMSDHLAKPIDADKLVRALARYRKDA